MPSEIILKTGPSFSLWTDTATISASDNPRHGVFLGDTRMISHYEFTVNGGRFVFHSQRITNNRISIQYNMPGPNRNPFGLTRDIRFFRDHFVDHWDWSHIEIPTSASLCLNVDADFRDIFDIRGFPRTQFGTFHSSRSDSVLDFSYWGRDGIKRDTHVYFDTIPSSCGANTVTWNLASSAKSTLTTVVSWVNPAFPAHFSGKADTDWQWPSIACAYDKWNAVFQQAQEDLSMLLTDYGKGPVPMAGLPWFGTLFGRDAIITAFQTLVLAPSIARATLYTLADLQGTQMDREHEEEPGKILHEMRLGEMTQTDSIPFGKYYGAADVTPLFICLFVETYIRTGDPLLLQDLLPHAEDALHFVLGQFHNNRFNLFAFAPQSPHGLTIQSWKDSPDSVVYRDGRHAMPPLAIAEVQGYVYRALMAMATLYQALHRTNEMHALRVQAQELQTQFHQLFWMPEYDYYALAIDELGTPVDALTSDPGHGLWSGIIPPSFRSKVVQKLIGSNLFSGWGIRTLGEHEVAYDALSYHRGSVWPHDTSLIIAGMHESGYPSDAGMVGSALLSAATHFPLHRLPELFSGQSKSCGGPFAYPEACAPQAWAAGASLLTLTALLGLKINHLTHTVTVQPASVLPAITIRSIPLNDGDHTTFSIVYDKKQVSVQDLPPAWTILSAPDSPNP